MWLLYDLTKDPFYTGMGGFMFSMADALNFFCGPIIDRCSKRWLLLITSAVQFFVLFGLYCLSANGTVHVPLLLLSIPVFDLMSKMTYSIHNTLIPILVKKEEWRTANTVLSITNTGIDLMFSAVAGVVLALFYLKTIFMVNSLINLAALVTAMFLFRKLSSKREFTDNETRASVPSLEEVWKGYREDLKSGIILVKNKTILSLVVPLVGLSLFYAMMLVNLPAFSARIFSSAMGYGFMLTLLAVGSIAGALLSGQLTKHFRLGRLFPQLLFWAEYRGFSCYFSFGGELCLLRERFFGKGKDVFAVSSNRRGIFWRIISAKNLFDFFSKKSLTFVEISVKINIVAREERLKMRI